MDWTILAVGLGCFLAGTLIPMSMLRHACDKTDLFQSEMRDLHGRVAKIEARLERKS
jgi:hypothetical protein